MKLMSYKFFKNKRNVMLGSLFLFMGGTAPVQASFQLESTGIVLKETEGRISFNISNSSSEPILLASKLEDLDKSGMSKNVLISPPITRIDAGQSQQVNFVLKKGVTLTHEIMLRASFEGVLQSRDNSARMPVRQSIGFIIQPASIAVSKAPWESLDIRMEGTQLVVNNIGKHVVRLAPMLTLKPSGKLISLTEQYLLVGDMRKFDVDENVTSIMLTPFSRYGFKAADVTLPVKR